MSKPTLFPESGFRRLRLELSYDGTEFAGWAKQPEQRTLQEEIEGALSKLAHSPVNSVVAGRTDAGVHAAQQFIHADIPDSPELIEGDGGISNWSYRLNRILDEDIRIHSVDLAPEGFHARFSATARHYTYKIADALRDIPPLSRFDVAPWYRALNEVKMNEVSAHMLGMHDFHAFCKYREGATTIRTLTKFDWHRLPNGFLAADISADAFCYSMVRNLVGAAVCIGEERFPKEWMINMLNGRERVPDSYVFPGRGLTLMRIDYPADDQLAARATEAMARRLSDQ